MVPNNNFENNIQAIVLITMLGAGAAGVAETDAPVFVPGSPCMPVACPMAATLPAPWHADEETWMIYAAADRGETFANDGPSGGARFRPRGALNGAPMNTLPLNGSRVG